MSDEVNHRRSRYLGAAMTIADTDQSSVSGTNAHSTQSVQI